MVYFLIQNLGLHFNGDLRQQYSWHLSSVGEEHARIAQDLLLSCQSSGYRVASPILQ